MNYRSRILSLRAAMKRDNLDALAITHLDHVRYLCGFTGSAALLVVLPDSAHFFTDSRYAIQSQKQVSGAKITIVTGEALSGLKEIPKLQQLNFRLGVNGSYLTLAAKDSIQNYLPKAVILSVPSLFTELGWVKDSNEISSIRKAIKIAETALMRVLPIVRPGMKETEVSAELEYQMLMLGSERPAFESIVASGYRSALPHGLASSKTIEKGDFLTFDWGATVNGYVSDITRTVVIGKASARQKKIYQTVLRSNEAAIAKVKAGIMARDVDAAARKVIDKSGYGKTFGHGTGHGIGFYIHVGPRVSPKSNDKLFPNNVITIEPGIYVEGFGGVRIEDDVRVTTRGGEVMTSFTKKLLEL